VTAPHLRIGLTLLEVLVATLLLGVGVLAVARLQVTGLHASRTARILQQLNTAAVAEMDAWRGSKITTAETERVSCATHTGGCSVEIRPCSMSGPDLVCGEGPVSEVDAYAITVTVEADGRSVELRSVVLP